MLKLYVIPIERYQHLKKKPFFSNTQFMSYKRLVNVVFVQILKLHKALGRSTTKTLPLNI